MSWSAALAGLRGGSPVSAAPLLLLDTITATIAGAYALRKLRAGYAGPAVRVRRTADSTEQDIGFAGAALDGGTLLAFCGSGNGFVSKWYDQSGLGQDVTQAATGNQPQIVAGGAVIALANAAARSSMKFAGSASVPPQNTSLINAAFAMGGAASAAASVAMHTAAAGDYGRVIGFTAPGQSDYGSNTSCIWGYENRGTYNALQAGNNTTIALGAAPFQATSVFSGSTVILTLDGIASPVNAASGTLAATGTLSIGVGGAGSWWDGLIAENIVITGALSPADQTVIRASQQTYYGTP